MTSGKPADDPDVYLVNDKALTGASGVMLARSAAIPPSSPTPNNLLRVERIVYFLKIPKPHYQAMHKYFAERGVFIFSVHRNLNPVLTATAVISEIKEEEDGDFSCLVELNLPQ